MHHLSRDELGDGEPNDRHGPVHVGDVPDFGAREAARFGAKPEHDSAVPVQPSPTASAPYGSALVAATSGTHGLRRSVPASRAEAGVPRRGVVPGLPAGYAASHVGLKTHVPRGRFVADLGGSRRCGDELGIGDETLTSRNH